MAAAGPAARQDQPQSDRNQDQRPLNSDELAKIQHPGSIQQQAAAQGDQQSSIDCASDNWKIFLRYDDGGWFGCKPVLVLQGTKCSSQVLFYSDGPMNPYTKSLLDQLDDEQLEAWVADWDSLEQLVIEIFRQGAIGPTQREQFFGIKAALIQGYEPIRRALAGHWRGLKAGGKPLTRDPYLQLLSVESLEGFIDNWPAMQLLPAAREALNLYLHERLESGKHR